MGNSLHPRALGPRRIGIVIAALLITAALGLTFWAFASAMTPYVDIQQAERLGSSCQVRGKILHNTVVYDTVANVLRFRLQDEHNQQIEVVYHGAKPESFDTAPETAVEGYVVRAPNGTVSLQSDTMTIKCPSKYSDNKNPYHQSKPGGST
ncbi:MAG: cytochrome c maturation protein CcmE [Armatimonadetes bacterium]|nr:cytochrome c maturation protein CcmE [Armatimonadota bacterium]MDE2206569.1 cytochrome c maturation protein CcmE [Armatimonadota bacterium]